MRFEASAPQFVVADVRAAAEFYRDRLGFEILGYFQEPPVHAIVARGPAEIFLARGRDGAGASNRTLSPVAIDAYLRLDDVDALAREFTERGVEIVEGPVDRVYGMREVAVRDRDGFLLVFGAESPDAGRA